MIMSSAPNREQNFREILTGERLRHGTVMQGISSHMRGEAIGGGLSLNQKLKRTVLGVKTVVVDQSLWAIARSNNMATWKKNMEKMKEMNLEAWAYLDGLAPNTWCRAFFEELPKCDLLLNNSCEVFNKWILDARELPILSMLRKIKAQLMTIWYTNRKQCEDDWSQLPLCPKIKKKLDKNIEWAKSCHECPTGKGVFKVMSRENEYVVDILKNKCSCRRWQLTGIPCSHSIACLRFERIKPEDKVAACYSIEAYRLAYGHVIMPCRDPAEWQKTNGPPVEPPKYEKKAGRKKKKRIVHPSEKDEGTRFSKHGVIMHCSVCNSTEHNRRKCTVLHPSDRVPALEKLPVRRNLLQAPTAQDSQWTEMTITQIPGEDSSHTCSVLSTLFQEVEASQVTPDAPPGPLPECSFIASRRDELPVPRAQPVHNF
uniref:SWIM-type domain-containing protein n=1 Tax=Triticum urartu TaxID=4572 RepID=A0A8R7QX94_TRIUA